MTTERFRAPQAPRTRAALLLAATAALWSTSGILIKLIDWNPLAIAGVRSLIAAAALFAYLRRPRFTWSLVQVGAALAYAGTMLLFVAANKLTTSANAIFLQYLSPVFVAVLGIWLLRERPRPVEWLIFAAVMGGMALLFVGQLSAGRLLGNLVAIASGICFALFIVLMRRQAAGSPLESMLLGHLIAAAVSLPFWFAGRAPQLGGWIALACLGLFQIGLTSITFAYAVKHLTALSVSIITLVEPVLNPVWVFLFAGETPTVPAIVGGSVILGMIALRSILAARAAAPTPGGPFPRVHDTPVPGGRKEPRAARRDPQPPLDVW